MAAAIAGYLGVQSSPVRVAAHTAAIEARVHPVAVELDFVEPLGAVRRFVDELW